MTQTKITSADISSKVATVPASVGDVLTADGSGATSWSPASGGGSPAGATGQLQFNTSGSFDADARLSWDNSVIPGAATLRIGAIIPTIAGPCLAVTGDSTTPAVNARISLITSTNTASYASTIRLARSRGAAAFGAGIQAGDAIGYIVATGFDTAFLDLNTTDSTDHAGGYFKFTAAETWSPSAHGTTASLVLCRPGTLNNFSTSAFFTVDSFSGNAWTGFNGQTSPLYPIDVVGDVNTTTTYKVGGIPLLNRILVDMSGDVITSGGTVLYF